MAIEVELKKKNSKKDRSYPKLMKRIEDGKIILVLHENEAIFLSDKCAGTKCLGFDLWDATHLKDFDGEITLRNGDD